MPILYHSNPPPDPSQTAYDRARAARSLKLKAEWRARLQPLVGRRIIGVSYLDAAEQQTLGIHYAAVKLHLDDGTLLWPMADDEGNDAGSLFIQAGTQTKTLPEQAPRL